MKRFATYMTLCLVVVVSSLSMTACSKDEGLVVVGAGDSPPQLPSQSTMLMDLSFFGIEGMPSQSQMAASSESMAATSAGEKSNWIQAVVRAIFVHLTLYDVLEEPVAAFAIAIHSVPQPQDDGSYLWTYIFVDEGLEYSIFLYGLEVGNRVEWRMEVSSNNPDLPLDHFVWFDGESMKDESGGFWQFYVPAETSAALTGLVATEGTEGVPVARIDWVHNGSKDNALTVTNNHVGSEGEGDLLEFRELPHMGTIDFKDADTEEHHNITWYHDGSGSLTVPDYNSGEEACWDTMQNNTVCP